MLYEIGARWLPVRCPSGLDESHVAHLYVLRTPRRDALRAHLLTQGVGCEVHYPIADHRQPVRRAESAFVLPVTEAACAEVISLPCHPALSPVQIGRVTEAVRAFFSQGGAC